MIHVDLDLDLSLPVEEYHMDFEDVTERWKGSRRPSPSESARPPPLQPPRPWRTRHSSDWRCMVSVLLDENPAIELTDMDETNLVHMLQAFARKAVGEIIVPAVDNI